MKLKVYTQRKYDNRDAIEAARGKSVILDSAQDFYTQLEGACAEGLTSRQRYTILRDVFRRVVEQSTMDCRIALVGLFSKVDYCIKENHVPDSISRLVHGARKEMFSDTQRGDISSEEALESGFPHNLKATAYLVHHLCGKEPIPETLIKYFPRADRKNSWGKFDEKVLRVVVERWDSTDIWVTEEQNGTTLQVCYGEKNTFLNRGEEFSWSYLEKILWQGAILHLVRIRMDEHDEVCLPELIILEPDYLVNITTIAGCFESYAESPFVNLVKKIQPLANTIHTNFGNLTGQLLDNAVHGRDVSFDDTFSEFVAQNTLSLISCPEFAQNIAQFKRDGMKQQQNIDKLINHDLPASMGEYDRQSVVLEPSYFSPTLGIQGRFDFLQEDDKRAIIIEQKSGKGDFVPYSANSNAEVPKAREQHVVQALLYRAIYQYEINDLSALKITPMLLYSRYSQGLLEIPPMPMLFLRAIMMRNLLTWCEILYAKEGMDILATLTPEKLNKKGAAGKLWEQYTNPQLHEILDPIHQASDLERAYYLRFMRFIENETLLSKVGNRMKEDSGFATIWNDTLEEKLAAGNIYDRLHIAEYGIEDGGVTSIKLRFEEEQSDDTSNFRAGDIVILYPYTEGHVPNACAQAVNRANIVDIKKDIIELRLRNPQTDKKVFAERSADTLWAIEHDMFESSATSLYGAMHSFLSAPKERRDLVLSQRMPEVDTSRQLRGNYGAFNELSLRAKQARDLFLIIGPPGTGKTSYGLVNLLKEELLEEGSNILLLSYTNRAVDEICSKLMEMESDTFDFIRIGSDLSCAPEYRDHLLCNRCRVAKSGNEVNRMIQSCRVFCGTTAALNANMALFTLKHFSLAIVDESSQILEPHLIGLLSATHEDRVVIEKFVLIGDHKQLPAVVQQAPEESVVTEPILREINLVDCSLSLFERLLLQFKIDGGYDPRFVYMLTKQGRMHRDISEFSNIAFYANKLDIVPLDHQLLPNIAAGSDNGIVNMLSSHRVAFVASQMTGLLTSMKTNSVEADMIAATVREIYRITQDSFDQSRTVGVIVPYRNQISTVRSAIDRYGIDVLHDITIDTVERYQGSQRDYIIYGFTVQQPSQLNFLTSNVFEEDDMVIDRKLNVAMTRARLNLVMIGNPAILRENLTFRHLMDFVRTKGGYIEVSAEDYCSGNFKVPSTQEEK